MATVPLLYAKGDVISLSKNCPLDRPVVADGYQSIEEWKDALVEETAQPGTLLPPAYVPPRTEELFHTDAKIIGNRTVVFPADEETIKLKGALYALFQIGLREPSHIFPPLALEYFEPRKEWSPYWFIYRYPSGKGAYWKFDHPRGVIFDTMVREGLVYNYLHFLGLSPGEECLGIAKYDLKYKNHAMGHGITRLTGPEWRTVDLTFDDPNHEKSPELAKATLERFVALQQSLDNPQFLDLVSDRILQESGRVLARMHREGVLHGPRQGNFRDYSVPDKNGIHPCDFENALLCQELTYQQFYEYALDDLIALCHNTDSFFKGMVRALVLLHDGKVDGPSPKGYEELLETSLWEPNEIMKGYFGSKSPVTEEGYHKTDVRRQLRQMHDVAQIRKRQEKTAAEFLADQSSYRPFPSNILQDNLSVRFSKRKAPPTKKVDI